jgi:hypothetical protein
MIVRQMRPEDIEQVRHVGQKAWSKLASEEMGQKVKYPFRPKKIINGYLWREPKGCLVVEDEGKVIASPTATSGAGGVVRSFRSPSRYAEQGVGKALLSGCEDYLPPGCTYFGLRQCPT